MFMKIFIKNWLLKIFYTVIIISATTNVYADPAFFQQKEWIRQQSAAPTTPYQQAAKQQRGITQKNNELKEDESMGIQNPTIMPPDSEED